MKQDSLWQQMGDFTAAREGGGGEKTKRKKVFHTKTKPFFKIRCKLAQALQGNGIVVS